MASTGDPALCQIDRLVDEHGLDIVFNWLECRQPTITKFFSKNPRRESDFLSTFQAPATHNGPLTPAETPAAVAQERLYDQMTAGSGLDASAAIDEFSGNDPNGLEVPSRASPHASDAQGRLSLRCISPHIEEYDRCSDDTEERGAQENISKQPHQATKLSGDGKRRCNTAKTTVFANIADVGNLGTLLELRHSLLSLRGKPRRGPSYQQSNFPYDCDRTTEKDVVDYLRKLQGHFDRLRASNQFTISLDRLYMAQVADLYYRMKLAKNFRGSLAVVFAKTIVSDDVRYLRNHSNRAIQMLWERYMRVARPWYSLVQRFGSGVLPIIPRELKDEHKADVQDAVGRVALENPHLQEEVSDLTSLLTCLMRDECLPEQGLLIESLSEDETRASSRGELKKLLGFCAVSTAASDQHPVGAIPSTGVHHLRQTEIGGVQSSK